MSINAEDKLNSWQQTIVDTNIINVVTDKFFQELENSKPIKPDDLQRAALAARNQLEASLLEDSVLNNLPETNAEQFSALRIGWKTLLPNFNPPAPQLQQEFNPLILAIAAGLGSWISDVLGAAIMVMIFMWLTTKLRNNWIVNQLNFIHASYNIVDYQQQVKSTLEYWIQQGSLLLFSLSCAEPKPVPIKEQEVLNPKLAQAIISLHTAATTEDLQEAAEDVFRVARSLKLQGIEGSPAFSNAANSTSVKPKLKPQQQWTSSMERDYEPFGNIEDGDLVTIETEPVIQNEMVLKRGQVRKVRVYSSK